jgi:hypothetical protein
VTGILDLSQLHAAGINFKKSVNFKCLRKIVKSDYYLRHVCLSVCPHRTTRLPLDEFSLNLIFEDCSKKVKKLKFH